MKIDAFWLIVFGLIDIFWQVVFWLALVLALLPVVLWLWLELAYWYYDRKHRRDSQEKLTWK